mgnify:FL=1
MGVGNGEVQEFRNAYGKTDGDESPSEGSSLWRYWCGGGHPSEVRSSEFLPNRRQEYIDFVEGGVSQLRRPILFKNAWNTFRIASLADAMPQSAFLWIRRDIRLAALSDYAARLHRGGPSVWNSASPRNLAALKRLPPYEQVVEQQYEFARATQDAFRQLDSRFTLDIWYDDILSEPAEALGRLERWLRGLGFTRKSLAPFSRSLIRRKSYEIGPLRGVERAIAGYVLSNHRLSSLCRN